MAIVAIGSFYRTHRGGPFHIASPRVLTVYPLEPYHEGISRCMKKPMHIDEKTLAEARKASGGPTDTETVRLGLEALIRHAAISKAT